MPDTLQALKDSAKQGPRRKGRLLLIQHLEGKRLTRAEAIAAKCYDCDGMGESGECDFQGCSLYPYSPYALKSLKAPVQGPVAGKRGVF